MTMFNSEKISDLFRSIHDKLYGKGTSFNNVFAGGNVGVAALAISLDGVGEAAKDFVYLEREKFEWTKKIAEDYKSMAQSATGLHPANGPLQKTSQEKECEQCQHCLSTNTVLLLNGSTVEEYLCHDCDRVFQMVSIKKPEKQIIIALAGQIGSGKGTVAKRLESKYGAKIYRFSDSIRDILDRLYQVNTRENMQNLSTALRKILGASLLSDVITRDIGNCKEKIVVIDGVRRPEDLDYLKDIPGFTFIYIDADIHNRFARSKVRRENPGDSEKSFEDFQFDCITESESQIIGLKDIANKTIDNNMGLKELYNQIDLIIRSLKKV